MHNNLFGTYLPPSLPLALLSLFPHPRFLPNFIMLFVLYSTQMPLCLLHTHEVHSAGMRSTYQGSQTLRNCLFFPGSHQPSLVTQLYLSTHEPLPIPCWNDDFLDYVQVMCYPAAGRQGVQGRTSQLSSFEPGSAKGHFLDAQVSVLKTQ